MSWLPRVGPSEPKEHWIPRITSNTSRNWLTADDWKEIQRRSGITVPRASRRTFKTPAYPSNLTHDQILTTIADFVKESANPQQKTPPKP